MRTTKPISTISYNTDDFLKLKLDYLVQEHRVEYWCYVFHHGELDEYGAREKDHKHLYIVPNGKIDTMDLREYMCELDINNPSKPLKCMDFRNSKEDEWFLYCSHDPDYLRSKFMVREYSYTLADFISSDEDETRIKFDRAFHESDYMKTQRILKLLESQSAYQLASAGFVAPQQALQMQVFDKMVRRGQIEDAQSEGFYTTRLPVPFEEEE